MHDASVLIDVIRSHYLLKAVEIIRPLVKSVNQNIILLLQGAGSFGHSKHILKLMGKKIFTLLRSKILLIKECKTCFSETVKFILLQFHRDICLF